jgi:hypothetical protein
MGKNELMAGTAGEFQIRSYAGGSKTSRSTSLKKSA